MAPPAPMDAEEDYYYEEEPMPPQVSAPEPKRPLYSRGRTRDVKIISKRGVFSKSPEESPVFVKLDRYEDVLSEITNIRQIIVNLKGIISIYGAIREMEGLMLSEWEKNVKRLEESELDLDEILMKMEPLKRRVVESKYAEISPEKSNTIRDLEQRISRLKSEISKMD
jgi:hypothetical protein